MAQRKRSVGRVRASAPVRADLAGGTLDLWPLGLFHPGSSTVAVAVDLRVEITVGPGRAGEVALTSHDLGRTVRLAAGDTRPPQGPLGLFGRIVQAVAPGTPLSLASRSPVRAGSGLGTSSALGVTAAAAVARATGGRPQVGQVVPLIRDIEAQVLGIPTGTQDHEAAWRGGLVTLQHHPSGARVSRTIGPVLDALAERLILVDSGEGRSSGPSNWDMFRRRIEGDAEAVRALGRVAKAGTRAAGALGAGDWRALGRAMREDLEARAGWSPLVLTPALEAIFAAAKDGGALGWKVCGAGGGGFAVVLAAPERGQRVRDRIRAAGGLPVEAGPTARGLTVRVG